MSWRRGNIIPWKVNSGKINECWANGIRACLLLLVSKTQYQCHKSLRTFFFLSKIKMLLIQSYTVIDSSAVIRNTGSHYYYYYSINYYYHYCCYYYCYFSLSGYYLPYITLCLYLNIQGYYSSCPYFRVKREEEKSKKNALSIGTFPITKLYPMSLTTSA